MKVDLGLLPGLTTYPSFYSLDDRIQHTLAAEPAILGRVQGALHFANMVRWNHESRGPHSLAIREAYLRAALGEIASASELLPKMHAGAPTLKQSSSPLPRLVSALRATEFHLTSSSLNNADTPIVFNNDQQLLAVWYIKALRYRRFRRLKSDDFPESEVRRTIAWCNKAQRRWGIDFVIFHATRVFCDEIAAWFTRESSSNG